MIRRTRRHSHAAVGIAAAAAAAAAIYSASGFAPHQLYVVSTQRNGVGMLWPTRHPQPSPRPPQQQHLFPSTTTTMMRPRHSRRRVYTPRSSSSSSSKDANGDERTTASPPKLLEAIVTSVSQTAAVKAKQRNDNEIMSEADRRRVNLVTLSRVAIPSLLAGAVATVAFPGLALTLASRLNDAGVFAVLSQDSSQFVQNFLTVAGLLFSILVGQTYYFMYQQQESVYYALFNEVTEAKSLLEQVALVCQGRSMYARCLDAIYRYVQDDLKKLSADPAVLLSARPVDDPLESIMYMTSVGVPSTVYETVRSLRQARAGRLGALQRKLPVVHMGLLWMLALIELISFPLLGAGTQSIGGYRILTVEGILFGVMTSGIVLTLRVVGELWRPAGGAYNVDYVLSIMVRGLLEELQARMAGAGKQGGGVASGGGGATTPSSSQTPSSPVARHLSIIDNKMPSPPQE